MFKPEIALYKFKINKMAKAKIVLFKPKTFKNGEHPVMLRITHDRKLKYYSLNLTTNPKNWDELSYFKRSEPDYKNKNAFLEKKYMQASRAILELEADDNFSMVEFDHKFIGGVRYETVIDFYNDVISREKEKESLKNAKVYEFSLKYFQNFDAGKDYTFKNFKLKDLVDFDHYLRSKTKLSSVSIHSVLRTFRSVVNRAIKAGLIAKTSYVFEDFRIKTPEETTHKALIKEQVDKIKDYKGPSQFAKNYFLFSYYCQGINHKDMALLKWNMISEDNLLSYKRSKTGQLITVSMSDNLWHLIDYFRPERKIGSSEYLLPILDHNIHQTPTEIQKRLLSHISQLNKALKRIAKSLDLPNFLSIGKARHTYATVLDQNGTERSVIGDAMGHRNPSVTKKYFGRRSNTVIAEANKSL